MAALRRYVPRSPTELLNHILEHKELVLAIRELPATTLSRLIDRIGVEDSGDLIALASTEQVAALLDQDLFRADESGFEERFDPARFALWLQVMGEAGEEFLVRRLSELPLDLLTLAVNRLVLVIDMDALRSYYAGARDEAGQLESALEDAVSEEWEEFCLIPRDLNAWEAVWNALLSLDRDHHTRLRAILEQCCAMSLEFIDGQGGLYDVLTSDEMLENDALASRDDRRASQGYVSRSDARAFLELARDPQQPLAQRDAITAGYFRTLDTDAGRDSDAPSAARRELARAGAGARELMRLVADLDMQVAPEHTGPRWLQEAKIAGRMLAQGNLPIRDRMQGGRDPDAGSSREKGGKPPRRRSRASTETKRDALESLAAGARDQVSDDRPLVRALTALASAEPTLHAARSQELAYLANVMLSGCTHEGRKLRPIEALEAAIATSNLGFELWERKDTPRSTEGDVLLVQAVGCDRMFRLAWAALQRDVGQVAAATLARRCALLDAPRAQKAQKCLSDRNPHGLRGVCAARDLGLDDGALAALCAWADPLPWQSGMGRKASDASPWIGTLAELERVQRRLKDFDES